MNVPVTDQAFGAVWIVIPVHNRRAVTERCLHHLENLGISNWAQVLIVDDGSTDGTSELITDQFPWAKIVHGDGYLWWTGAIRLGMASAIREGADTICWLNDDCLPDPGALEKLVHLARCRRCICGGVCRTGSNPAIAYGGGFMKGTWPAPLRRLPADPLCEVDWLHGNMVAIPSHIWQRVGLPEDRWMRHTLADIAYTFKAHELGIPVLLVTEATAQSEVNQGPSYQSWASRELGSLDIIRGLWSLRVWWYAPGLTFFLWDLFGIRGLVRLAQLTGKLLTVLALKAILPGHLLSTLAMSRNQADDNV